MYTMEYYSVTKINKTWIYATTWMKLENIILSERRTTYWMIFVWNVQNRQIYRQKVEWWLSKFGVGVGMGGNESVLQFSMVMVTSFLCILKAIELHTLNKWTVMDVDYISIKLFKRRIWKWYGLRWIKPYYSFVLSLM